MEQISQPSLRVDDELIESLSAAQEGQWSVTVKPPKQAEDDVLDQGERLFQSLHDEFDRFSFELHQNERGAIEFRFMVESKPAAERIQEQILSSYPLAEAEIEPTTLPIERGDVLTGARIDYEQDHLLPLLNGQSASDPDGDPYKSILDTMANSNGQQCVLQTVIEPVGSGWTTRWARGLPYERENGHWWTLPTGRDTRWDSLEPTIAVTLLAAGGWWLVTQWFAYGSALIEPLFVGLGMILCAMWWMTLFGQNHIPRRRTAEEQAEALREKDWTEARATRGERQTADQIAEQAREDCFRVSIRLITIDGTPGGAREYLDRLGGQLRTAFHDSDSRQRLDLSPIRPLERRVRRFTERLAQRSPARDRLARAANKALTRARRRRPAYMAANELAAWAHPTDEDSGGEGAIDYAPPRLSARVPPAAGMYDRPGGEEQPGPMLPQRSPIARAGAMLADRLPGALADRLDERFEQEIEDGSATPTWTLDEREFAIEVDDADWMRHDRYGDVQTHVYEHGDPADPDDEGDLHMGAFFRELIESKRQNPRDDIWIGYQERGGTIREVGIPFETLFTHVFVQGATGQGKSTIAASILAQWAWAGYGFCLPDPSGELVEEVMTWLPEHRKDDVVYFDPEPETAKRMVGLNLLEIEADPGDPNYDATVDGAIDEIVAVLKDEDYWGRRMDGVVRNLARVMITADEPFTFVDLHGALSDTEGREELAAKAGKDDEFVAKYTRKIAEMEDDDLDALIRRINGWVESKVARQVISHQDSTISIKEAIEQNKPILVDLDVSKDSIQRLIGVGVWRRVWRHCRDRPEGERVPYALLADEFDDFLSDEMNVDEQVRNARKYRLCLILMTQYLGALDNGDVENALDEECTTVISYRIKSRTGAGEVANMHGLDDKEYLTKLEKFHAIIELEINNKPRGPFEISILPPVTPQRTPQEAREEIAEPALERDGTEMLSDQEIREQAIIGSDEIEADEEASARRNATALKAIEDAAIRAGSPGEFVPLADCVTRLNDYLDESFRNADDAWRNALQDIPETQLVYREPEDEPRQVKVLDRPWLGVGEDVTSGGREHALIMEDAYQPLSQLGFVVDVLDQDAGAANQSMPDALAKPDDALDLDGLDPVEDAGEIADRVNEFRTSDDHSQIVRLTGVKDGYIEAEHSTSGTQPSQAVMNAIEAHNDDSRCLYLIRPELASKLHGYLEAPAGCRSNHDVHSETRFYTRTGALKINGKEMTRPGTSENVWIRDEDTDQLVLRDGSGTEHARFDSAYEVFNDDSAYPIENGERTVTPPLIPEHELVGDDTMEDVEWDIIVVPHPEIDEDDERQRLTPLDLDLYQPIGNNVSLIDLPVSPAQRDEQNEESNQQINTDDLADAISDARFSDD